jgi:hypothetical protein
MAKKKPEDRLDLEFGAITPGPVRQSVNARTKEARRLSSARRKTKSGGSKTPTVAGIHKRTKRRMGW